MTSTPDSVVELHPDYCRNCGSSLSSIQATKRHSRQVVDIPPIKSVITEYQVFNKQCNCGCQNQADFPEGVKAAISYGPNIEGMIGYFHARQYLPFARMRELFNDIFNINISEGGIHYLLNRFSDKLTPVYELIKQRVAASKVIGTDETGAKVHGNKHWFWTWQSDKLTFISHSHNRGSAAIEANFPNGFPNSTLVHDGWKAQCNTLAKYHQSCTAHLQRSLKYLNQLYQDNHWGKDFLKLLYDAISIKKYIDFQDKTFLSERNKTIRRFDALLDKPPNKKDKELFTFYKRILRKKQHVFTFLFIKEVPPDNNASERAIRNIKVKQKISGQFKTQLAAQNFAKIRSVIDTTIKNQLNVIKALNLIAKCKYNI